MEKYKIRDSFEEYLSKKEYITSSDLSKLAKSPAHFIHSKSDDDAEETQAQKIGTAIHCLVLEPSEFKKRYCTFDREKVLPFPDKDYKTVANRVARDSFYNIVKAQGMICLDTKEWDQVLGMADSVTQNPTFMQLIQGSVTEESHYMECDEFGIKIRLRPDSFNHTSHFLISLKSTKDASPDGFARECVKYHYPEKEAFYNDYMGKFYDKPLLGHCIIAIENVAPYHHAIYNLTDDFLETGRYLYRTYLDRLKSAKDKNKFQGYDFFAEPGSFGIINLQLPNWAKKELVL